MSRDMKNEGDRSEFVEQEGPDIKDGKELEMGCVDVTCASLGGDPCLFAPPHVGP